MTLRDPTMQFEAFEAFEAAMRIQQRADNMVQEQDPHGRNPHEPGAKLDAGKEPVRRGLLEYFPRACLAVARVSAAGAKKYAWKGWENVIDGINRYGDAEVRHICKAAIHGEQDTDWKDPETVILHAEEEAWNAMARLELLLREREKGGETRK